MIRVVTVIIVKVVRVVIVVAVAVVIEIVYKINVEYHSSSYFTKFFRAELHMLVGLFHRLLHCPKQAH